MRYGSTTATDRGPVDTDGPLDVSVVIPTLDRPTSVLRAVQSAGAQRPPPGEIIVVSDGLDPRLGPLLAAAGVPGVRLIETVGARGAPAARNAGIMAALKTWVALLDDDDEWRPDKLRLQLAAAAADGCKQPVVACSVEVRTSTGRYVLPRRSPSPGEPISEWLTVRHGLFHGEGFVQTSTLLARRELFERVPFDETLARLQETDWLLRALAAGACLRPLQDVLVSWDARSDRARISAVHDWRGTLLWARRRRDLFTARAYGALLLSIIADMAASGDRHGFRVLLWEARRDGDPSLIDYLTYLQIWLVPPHVRRWLGGLVLGLRRPARARSVTRSEPKV